MISECGMKLVKLAFFTFNGVVWAASACQVLLGVWILIESAIHYPLFSEYNYNNVAALLLSVGAFGFIIGFGGCCGAIRNSLCLLRTHFVFLVLILLGEISAGAMTFAYRADIEQSMTIGMKSAIHSGYGEYVAESQSIDLVQRKFHCCGAIDYTDYHNSVFRDRNGPESLPPSCCTPEDGLCYTFSWTRNEQGCVEASEDFLYDSILILGLVIFGLVVLEIIAMVCTCCLIVAVKSERDYPYRPIV